MDVCLAIKQRLGELGLEQKDLAAAAGVTDSYVSQLLGRKKLPPAPDRTDIYDKMGKILKLAAGHLAGLAEHQRKEELRRSLAEPPHPLLKELRELTLRKCARTKEKEIRAIFEKQPFGELERLVTQKLLDVAKKVAKQELESENWLELVAQLNGRSRQEMRVFVLEFLDTDLFSVSAENCACFLDPLIDSWDIDLANFGMEIVLDRRLAPGYLKRLEFVERETDARIEQEVGLKEFLGNASMSADVTSEEIEFLKALRFNGFKGGRPTGLYYYRELQNLRDPLNFLEVPAAPPHKYGEAGASGQRMRTPAAGSAPQNRAKNKGGRPRHNRKVKNSR